MKNILISIPKGRLLNDFLIFFKYFNIIILNNYKISRKTYLKIKNNSIFLINFKNLEIFKIYNFIDIIFLGSDIFIENFINIFIIIYNINILNFKICILSKKINKYKFNFYLFFTKYIHIINNYLIYSNIKNIKICKNYSNIEFYLNLNKYNFILDIINTKETIYKNNIILLENIINLNPIIVLNYGLIYKKIFIFIFKNIFYNYFFIYVFN